MKKSNFFLKQGNIRVASILKTPSLFNHIMVLSFGLFFYFASTIYGATEELVIEEINEFGGKTIEYTGHEDTYLSVIIQFAADGKPMIRQNHYMSGYALLNGLQTEKITYLFGIKVEEDFVYTRAFARSRGVQRKIISYEQSTGIKIKSINYFKNQHLGFNTIFFEEGIRQKIEWNYPKTKNGVSKTLTFFSKNGKERIRVESQYTELWAKKKGFYKTISYLGNNKKLKEEWYYTEVYSQTHGGYVKKLINYSYDIVHDTKSQQVYYFALSGKVIPFPKL